MSKNKKKDKNNFETDFIKEAFNYEDEKEKKVDIDEENFLDLSDEDEKEKDREESFKSDKEDKNDTTSLSVIDNKELDNIMKEDLKENKKHKEKVSGINVFVNVFTLVTMIVALVYFVLNILNENSTLESLINCSILSVFTIIYLVVCLTYRKKNKGVLFLSTLLLCVYFSINIGQALNGNIITSSNTVIDLNGKSVVDAIKWANKNKLKIVQEYEFSDMVPEYQIISQSVKVGTNLNDIDEIILSISEGPNPYKEIIVPSMLTWDSERVINFVKSNYLSNVVVEFVESDQVRDTVIEQSVSGNIKRNDELKLVFSYGDEGIPEEVNLIDFTSMSKFEIEFFMKQHKINYSFEEDFSSKIKKGYGVSQSVEPGVININDNIVIVTISKGPKIVIPELKNMSVTELTDWAVSNKLKLEFIDKYDDSVKVGNVVSIDKEKDDVVEQGTTIKVTLSLGSLKMPDFSDVNKFYTWADKYEIKYEVRHEFNDDVPAGEVISYSYKKGAVIKNDEAIVVVISDGTKKEVPKLSGLTKKQAISKLEDADLKYNFIYRNSTTEKDKVIAQSISAGSEVSSGTTITVTLSNGKAPSSSSGQSSSGSGSVSNPTPTPTPEVKCDPVTVTIQSALNGSSVSETSANYQRSYSNVKFNFVPKASDVGTTGMVHPDTTSKRKLTGTTCDTFTIYIIQN